MEIAHTKDASADLAQAWTPSDYALRGQFCPVSEIERRLEASRLAARATGAVLFAADDSVVLSTLSSAVPHENRSLVHFDALLKKGELMTGSWARELLDDRRASLPELIRTSIPVRGRKRTRFPATAPNLLRIVAEIARRQGMEDLGSWIDVHRERWIPARIPMAARKARISTAILYFEPNVKLHLEDEIDVVVADDDILRMTECVNGTVQADVRRDDAIMRRLDRRLSPFLRAPAVDFEATARALLELAVDGSGSSAGACYLIDPVSQQMELAAEYMPQHLTGRWAFELKIPNGRSAVVPVSAEEGQAIQLPPGLQTEPHLDFSCHPRKGTQSCTFELATPMPGPLSSPGAPAIGALTLVKLDAEADAFGAYEVALARNGALRLALISATTRAGLAARTFTSLSRDASRLRRNALVTNMMLRAQRQQMEVEDPRLERILPDDLAVVLPVVENVLSTLAEVTQSETATFRAALPDPNATVPHGVALARIAAYPQSVMDDERFAVQPDNGLGINWKVAKEGAYEYRSDVTRPKAKGSKPDIYVRHHENTRSELCVPVFAEDRVVGVVNLESPVRYAYDSQIDIAQALAEHVGTAIANARLVLSGVLQAQARDVLRKSHDLSHAHEDLRKVASEAPSELAAAIEDAADNLQREAEALLTFKVDPGDDSINEGSRCFPGLVDLARKKSSLEFTNVTACEGNWAEHSPEDAALIVKALIDILDNARRNRDPDHPYIALELRQCEWGGQIQDILISRIRVDGRLRPSRAVNVYRCPLSNIEVVLDEQREPISLIDHPQLGAYLAGTHARRAGGDVHLTYLNGDEARVVFSVPSPKGA